MIKINSRFDVLEGNDNAVIRWRSKLLTCANGNTASGTWWVDTEDNLYKYIPPLGSGDSGHIRRAGYMNLVTPYNVKSMKIPGRLSGHTYDSGSTIKYKI